MEMENYEYLCDLIERAEDDRGLEITYPEQNIAIAEWYDGDSDDWVKLIFIFSRDGKECSLLRAETDTYDYMDDEVLQKAVDEALPEGYIENLIQEHEEHLEAVYRYYY